MSRITVDNLISGFVILCFLAVIGLTAVAEESISCRVLSYEPTRNSTARLSVELTNPDASSSPRQRLDCTCREWP